MSSTTRPNPPVTHGSLAELKSLLQEFDTTMLTTVAVDGSLRSRPMAVQNNDELPGCDLWFVTSIDSPKVGEISADRHVNVSAIRARDRAYLSISAWAVFERDEALIRRLFKPDWKFWFPDGPDDPSIALMKMRVEYAEYWAPEGGRARVLFSMLKAKLSGESAANALPPRKQI